MRVSTDKVEGIAAIHDYLRSGTSIEGQQDATASYLHQEGRAP